MKFVEDQIHKVKPLFEKGGKLEKFYYLFEAGESFHLVTDKRTDRGAHVRDSVDLKRMMITVVLAMVPCILFGIYNTGLQHYTAMGEESTHVQNIVYGAQLVIPVILTVYITGGIVEGIFACIRKHEINEGFLVTGILIALVVPATSHPSASKSSLSLGSPKTSTIISPPPDTSYRATASSPFGVKISA